MADTDPLPQLKSMLEYVGGAAAVVAVVGYSSLRAHLNHLGIAGIANLQPVFIFTTLIYFCQLGWQFL